MNSKELYNAFIVVAIVTTGLTIVTIGLAIKYSVSGLLAQTCSHVWVSLFGIDSISKLIGSIKELRLYR